MKNLDEDMYSKKAPSAEDLQVIDEGMDEIIKDANAAFEEHPVDGEVVQGKKGKVVLTKSDLEAIDEMVRIIEDPNYISPVRARRLGIEEEAEAGLEEMSFDDSGNFSNEDTMYEYRELYL